MYKCVSSYQQKENAVYEQISFCQVWPSFAFLEMRTGTCIIAA